MQLPPTQVDSLDVPQTVKKQKSEEDLNSLTPTIKRPKPQKLDKGSCDGESIIKPDLDPQNPSTGDGAVKDLLMVIRRRPRDGWIKWKVRGHCCDCDQQCEFYNANNNAKCVNCKRWQKFASHLTAYA